MSKRYFAMLPITTTLVGGALMTLLIPHLLESVNIEALFPILLASPFVLLCILAMLIAWKDVTVIRAACILAILAGLR